MSKLFEEAIADAKKLREAAEENAKKKILESVTPRIREFIDQQILNQADDYVEIDKKDIKNLSEMLGLDKSISQSAASRLDNKQKKVLKEMTKKVNSGNILDFNKINTIDDRFIKELLMNKNRYFEVDLGALKEAVERQADELYANEELKAEMEEIEDGDESYMFEDSDEEEEEDEEDEEEEEDEEDEEEEEEEDEEEEEEEEDEDEMYDMLNEIKLALDLGEDIEEEMLPEELRGLIIPEEGEEGELDSEDLEADSEDLESDDMEAGLEDSEELPDLPEPAAKGAAAKGAAADLPPLSEVFDVDPRMLRQELRNVKKMLSEGKMDHHFGGKGSGSAGHKNAFGGTGPKKAGYQNSFGGGSYGKDVFTNPPSSLKKLNESIRKLKRANRVQAEKLNKYRSAVQTLREQLEDLNLFNAKLLYVNKLLQNKSLNESQKKSVIKAIDEAKSLGETKALFKSLTESLTPARSLNESTVFGSSSRATTSASNYKEVGTSDRWAKLAGLK